MRKIFILGLTASGKTTLASKLSKKLGIDFYSTDDMVFKKKWTERRSEKEKLKEFKKVLKNKRWIIEGVHTEWILDAVKQADLVIILNPKKKVMVKRAWSRAKLRRESFFDRVKLTYWIFRWGVKSYLNFEKHAKKFIVLKNDKEVRQFLRSMK